MIVFVNSNEYKEPVFIDSSYVTGIQNELPPHLSCTKTRLTQPIIYLDISLGFNPCKCEYKWPVPLMRE